MSIDWQNVRRLLVVRLRSIGDTVLATPSLIALRRFLPDAQIDILLEDPVAGVLAGLDDVNVIGLPTRKSVRVEGGALSRRDVLFARAITVWFLREQKYDVAFNLHGGTTGTFFTFASGARHRVGYREYQYSFLYNHLLSSSADFWHRSPTHSAEQQLALLGFVGVPVEDRPKSRLAVDSLAAEWLEKKFRAKTQISLAEFGRFALIHPAAAFKTKRWAAENFARVAEFLSERGCRTVAVAAPGERGVLEALHRGSRASVVAFDDLSLPEITALASKASLFVGNDSGIAHIAAAVNTPTVVIFGSSNVDHWRPWTDAPNEIVRNPLDCQPCAGYECRAFGEPRCILDVSVAAVESAIRRVLERSK
ncbi:MAG: glycosyltransferase family 9 protein [Pyrinomonadaceae bacterium]